LSATEKVLRATSARTAADHELAAPRAQSVEIRSAPSRSAGPAVCGTANAATLTDVDYDSYVCVVQRSQKCLECSAV